VIAPRSTRLLRVADLGHFRDALSALAIEGDPLAARDRLIIVPSASAATHLRRSIEDRALASRAAAVLPEFVTRATLAIRLAERLTDAPPLLSPFDREILLGVSARTAATDAPPPFRLRPGLVAEILKFYDALRRQQKDIEAFERLMLGALEPNAAIDRGAERLVRQTKFLASAFRDFEARCAATGALDEHALKRILLTADWARPWRHIVVAVRDRAAESYGLWPADFDLIARLPGVERLDVVVTENGLGGGFHERLHEQLPGIQEVRVATSDARVAGPTLAAPTDGSVHLARDREEEVSSFARWVRQAARRSDPIRLDRTALVVSRPLPYVYLAQETMRSAGIPCQLYDALPLAAEPYAAALDLVFSFVATGFSRGATCALLQSPHFQFSVDGGPLSEHQIDALDRALSRSGYLGGTEHLQALVSSWSAAGPSTRNAASAGMLALRLATELCVLESPAAGAEHLQCLLTFLEGHKSPPYGDAALQARQLRARAAITMALASLRDAYAAHDDTPVDLRDLARTAARWIEAQTFSPRAGEGGVHVVDAASASFGDFVAVQLAGLIEGEWPERPRRSIFYSPALLRDLGWPSDADRIEGARALFADLLRLPADWLRVSAFSLEDDSIVTTSMLVEEIERCGMEVVRDSPSPMRIFRYEALAVEPYVLSILSEAGRDWAHLRLVNTRPNSMQYRGFTTGHTARSFSLSALERYQDCPFKFFAEDVLRLEEPPEDEPGLTPRTRGRFLHEVFQRFFAAWDASGQRRLTTESFDKARMLFAEVAEPLLAALPDADAWLERGRLFGSATSVGIVDVVLGLEAGGGDDVQERWLEHRFDGEFALCGTDGRRIPLHGVADRVDLLSGRRLRVIDYKSGMAPSVKRALQVPVYALCAAEQLQARDGEPWTVDEAAYVAFSGKRALVPVVRRKGSDSMATLADARKRVFDAVDAIALGQFPPKPHDPAICAYCAFSSVCRKDYVGDE